MPKTIDWPPIEQAWRETRTTAAALAKMHGISAQSLTNHMTKRGIQRVPPMAVSIASTALPALVETTDADLATMRKQLTAAHRQDIGLSRARLNAIAARIDANARLSDKQRLDFLAIVVKVQAQVIELERKTNSIIDAAPPPAPPAAIQVNINLSPQDAYLQLIGKK